MNIPTCALGLFFGKRVTVMDLYIEYFEFDLIRLL